VPFSSYFLTRGAAPPPLLNTNDQHQKKKDRQRAAAPFPLLCYDCRANRLETVILLHFTVQQLPCAACTCSCKVAGDRTCCSDARCSGPGTPSRLRLRASAPPPGWAAPPPRACGGAGGEPTPQRAAPPPRTRNARQATLWSLTAWPAPQQAVPPPRAHDALS
jgi:hypothetical protein